MKRSVYIIEDDMFYATILNEELKRAGVEKTKIFYTAKDFLKVIDEKPDIVLLDHQLGSENGVDLLRKIKTTYPEIEVIFLSGQEELGVAVKALKYGAFDYVEKNSSAFARVKRLLNRIDHLKRLISENAQVRRAKRLAFSAIAVFFGVLIVLNTIYPKAFTGL